MDSEHLDGRTNGEHKPIHRGRTRPLGRNHRDPARSTSQEIGKIFEEFGQSEPLTRRLKNLLEEYSDGSAVFKELIQNADDAGATEVSFLYDERENQDTRTDLISSKMAQCQGPALWVHNNAVFTEGDFEAITKLSGATKQENLDKIGRFGLGFNVVYHLTDVPSFLSRNYLVIFDPHTTHLGAAIRDKYKPGLKLDLVEKKDDIGKLWDQLQPYDGVFGCNITREKDIDYSGTLFRFPLRDENQAEESEICNKHYSDSEIKSLIKTFIKGSGKVLLFTQNVCSVSVYHLPRDEPDPRNMKKLFSVSKSLVESIRTLKFPVDLPPLVQSLSGQTQHFIRQCSVPKAVANVMKDMRKQKLGNNLGSLPECSMVISINRTASDLGVEFTGESATMEEDDLWFICYSMGSDKSLKVSQRDNTLMALGSTAVPLCRVGNKYHPIPIQYTQLDETVNGTVFCFLPLPIHSGLPFHVNGGFAVTSNRTHLCEFSEDEKDDVKARWNATLMNDAICNAIVSMLEDLKHMVADGYDFTCLWPTRILAIGAFKELTGAFYKRLIHKNGPALLNQKPTWANMDNTVLLHSELFKSEIGPVAHKIMSQAIKETGKIVACIPDPIVESFYLSGITAYLEERIYSMVDFFNDVFLPNCEMIPSKYRDKVIVFALNVDRSYLHSLIQQYKCIPSGNGSKLRTPSQLVNPLGHTAKLFTEDDARFPHGSHFLTGDCLATLIRLGMSDSLLSWDNVVERAQSVLGLNKSNRQSACRRAAFILDMIEVLLEDCEEGSRRYKQLQSTFTAIQFLPVMSRPDGLRIKWKGDDFGRGALAMPEELCQLSYVDVACSLLPVVDESKETGCSLIKERTVRFLRLERNLTPANIVQQLKYTQEVGLTSANFEIIHRICHACYTALQDKLDSIMDSSITDTLRNQAFIITEDNFLLPDQLAFKSSSDCSPYLNQVPLDLARNFAPLLRACGVRETFQGSDFVTALDMINAKNHGRALTKDILTITLRIIKMLDQELEAEGDVRNEINLSSVYLPDTCGVLYHAKALKYNDCPWMKDSSRSGFAHPDIPYETCQRLGVDTRRDSVVSQSSRGIAFGQKEKLTNRLKRILSGYPCDKEILKELVQNADDAGATEVCFIKDARYHSDEKLFADSWKPLQGPALCVYNNRPFTEGDLAGIQNVGEGSKAEDPNKTGQYGIGFNSVYHITEVPSFVTASREIGELMCVFDPQCKYVPGSTVEEPGRMYTDIDAMRSLFPDMMDTYLPKQFDIFNGTLFRFPLRTDNQARYSSISNIAMSIQNLDLLLETLQQEMFDVLLFVNNVEKLSIGEIDPVTNELMIKYSVVAKPSDEDATRRKKFANEVKTSVRALKKKEIDIKKVPMKEVYYSLLVEDSIGRQDEWFITRRLGYEGIQKFPNSVAQAFARGDLRLMPRGGVASLLSSNSQEAANKKSRAYCFLPLPVYTGLPVHINGHFALDHEARRNLWVDDGAGPRSDWNMMILREVVSPCWGTHMCELRSMFHLMDSVGGLSSSNLHYLPFYKAHFPDLGKVTEFYWSFLVKVFYRHVNESKLPILPVVRPVKSSSVPKSPLSVEETEVFGRVDWLSSNSDNVSKCYFNSFVSIHKPLDASSTKRGGYYHLESPSLLSKALLNAGFNLVDLPRNIFDSMSNSGLRVSLASPKSVIDFFKTQRRERNTSYLGNLPCQISESCIRDIESLVTILIFCKEEPEFLSSLNGLPLLLRGDCTIDVYDTRNKAILSEYSDIVDKECVHFVHDVLYREVFKDVVVDEVSVFKPFTVNLLAEFMFEILPQERYYQMDKHVPWNPDSQELPNFSWLSRVWQFMATQTKVFLKKGDMAGFEACLSNLGDWTLIPACLESTDRILRSSSLRNRTPRGKTSFKTSGRNRSNFLVPTNMGSTVFDPVCSSVVKKLKTTMRKLKITHLDLMVFGLHTSGGKLNDIDPRDLNESYRVVEPLAGSLNRPVTLLSVLDHAMEKHSFDNVLSDDECNQVLQYFADHVDDLRECPEGIDVLRDLPIFESVDGLRTRITGKTYILPEHTPRTLSGPTDRVIFLKKRDHFQKFYLFLGCFEMTDTRVYLDYIIEQFDMMGSESRRSHLEHLRDEKLPSLEDEEYEYIVEKLRLTNLIPDCSGSLRTVSFFCDPRIGLFTLLLEDAQFPPPPYNRPEWLDFLSELGLCQVIDELQFLDFANMVSREAKLNPGSEKLYEQSKALVDYFFKQFKIFSENVLRKLASITFIAPSKEANVYEVIYKAFNKLNSGIYPYIAFKASVPEQHAKLCWSSSALLPEWADPTKHSLDGQQLEILLHYVQIQLLPVSNTVVSHLQNICHDLDNERKQKNKLDDYTTMLVNDVMTAIYRFLQEHASNTSNARDRLKHTPCILIDGGRRMVRAMQIVLNLYDRDEIKPYLYRCPPGLGEFHRIFKYLGSYDSVSVNQYAMVLEMIHRESGGEVLHPNEMMAAHKAVEGFFRKADTGLGGLEFSVLYLPSQHDVMAKSTELVFNNDPVRAIRMKDFDRPFVMDPSIFGFDYGNFGLLLSKLPAHMQPQLLTRLVVETLEDYSLRGISTEDVATDMQQRFSSHNFRQGITRLIRHECAETNQKVPENLDFTVSIQLDRVRVFGVKKLATYLKYKNKRIAGSESLQDVFVLEEDDVINIYIKQYSDLSGGLLVKHSAVVNRITGSHMKSSMVFIPQILNCPIRHIKRELDKWGVRKNENDDKATDLLPELGTYIPLEHHHLLKQDIEEFEPGEYVGYELGDPTDDDSEGMAVYVYAVVIIEELPAPDEDREDGDIPENNVIKMYKIDIANNEYNVVSATELYKFHRIDISTSTDLAITNNDGDINYSWDKYLNAERAEVRRLLLAAWELPEKQTKKVIKRLLLKWHPDKATNMEPALCTEMIQFIQNEIGRLQQIQKTIDGLQDKRHGKFDAMFDRMDERGREHKKQKQNYSKRYEKSAKRGQSDLMPPALSQRNPQPGEARRWLRQAQTDFKSAQLDHQSKYHEWATFKYFQTVEKALVAACFSMDALRFDNDHKLFNLASRTEDALFKSIAVNAEALVVDFHRPLYPDQASYPRTPHEEFGAKIAVKMQNFAKTILEKVPEFVHVQMGKL